jgi:hypothetical protein
MAGHTCAVMVGAPLAAKLWRRTAGVWTVLESRGEPTHPLGTRLSTISGYTADVFWLVAMTPVRCRRASARPLAPGISRCTERYAKKETSFGGGVGTLTSGVRGCESWGVKTVRCMRSVGVGGVACIPGTGTQKPLGQQTMLMPRH